MPAGTITQAGPAFFGHRHPFFHKPVFKIKSDSAPVFRRCFFSFFRQIKSPLTTYLSVLLYFQKLFLFSFRNKLLV